MNNATPLDLLAQELHVAVAAIGGNDAVATDLALEIEHLLADVSRTTRNALGESAQLHGDKWHNQAGVADKLAAIPGRLIADTAPKLEEARAALELVEKIHLNVVLRHESKDDANLREELRHYVAGITPETAAKTLVGIAADVRYSTYMAGPMGKALASEFSLAPDIFRKVALEALAVNGTEAQKGSSAALAAIKDAGEADRPTIRRVVGIGRGAVEAAITEVQTAPKPAPTTALF